jgi:hypothetical protein
MKTALGIVLAFALVLSVMPAGASDTFYTFSTLPAVEQARLTPLSDGQLAVVEGAQFEIEGVCAICVNVANVAQANVNTSAFSSVRQRNRANVYQSNRGD